MIDKDNKPRWKNKSVDEITDEEIESMFSKPHTLNLDLMGDYKDAITYN